MNLAEIKEKLMSLRRKKPNWTEIDRLSIADKKQFIEDIINIYPEHKNDFSHEEKKILILLLKKLDNDINNSTSEKSPEILAQQIEITELLGKLQNEVQKSPAFQRYQEDQAARKIQAFVRKNIGTTDQRMKWQRAVVTKQKNWNKQKESSSTTLYPSDIFARFQHRDYLGRGSFGQVYSVLDARDNQAKAYKSGGSFNDEVRVVVTTALNEGYTPHLTRIFDIIKLREVYSCYALSAALVRDQNHRLQEDKIPREVLLANIILNEPQYTGLIERTLGRTPSERRHRQSGLRENPITVMEKLDGDMRSRGKGLSLSDWIQVASTTLILRQTFKTRLGEDDGWESHNIFYKKLTDSDIFKEKKLMDYDYWLYKIGDDEFYIPRPEYLLKLGDYDEWRVYGSLLPMNDADLLRECLSQEQLVAAREQFKKPPGVDDSRILDMSPPSLTHAAKKKSDPSEKESVSSEKKSNAKKPSAIGLDKTGLKLIDEFKNSEPTDELIKVLIRRNAPLNLAQKKTGKTLFECMLSHPAITPEDIVFVFMYHPDLEIHQAELALAACHLTNKSFQVLFDHVNKSTARFNWLGILEHAALNPNPTSVMRVVLKAHSQKILDALKDDAELSCGYILIGLLCSGGVEQRERRQSQIRLLAEFKIDPKDIARKLDSKQQDSPHHYLHELEKIIRDDSRPHLSEEERHEISKIIKFYDSQRGFFKKRNDFLNVLEAYVIKNDRLAIVNLIHDIQSTDSENQKQDKALLETIEIINKLNGILNKPDPSLEGDPAAPNKINLS